MKHLKQHSKLLKPAALALAIITVFAIAAFTPVKPTMVVVIDAGHGGKDPGNLGTGRYSSTEKDITLAVSNKLASYIGEKMPDVKVILTRKDDSFPKLTTRVKIANNAEADVFISIHCDAFSSANALGSGTYVMGMHKTEASLKSAMRENASIYKEDDYEKDYAGFDPNDPDTYIALSLRQNIFLDNSLQLGTLIQNQFRERVSRHDRGVKQAGFVVISRTTMPSVLVELGFLTNPKEERFLLSEKGQDYMASAIFRAFRSYKEKIEGLNSQVVIENNNESITKNDVQFKVQFLSSRQKVALNQLKFEDTALVDYYETNGWIKYTYGQTVDYKEAKDLLKEAKKAGYSEAFVVAFKNGERIPVKDAVAELKNRN